MLKSTYWPRLIFSAFRQGMAGMLRPVGSQSHALSFPSPRPRVPGRVFGLPVPTIGPRTPQVLGRVSGLPAPAISSLARRALESAGGSVMSLAWPNSGRPSVPVAPCSLVLGASPELSLVYFAGPPHHRLEVTPQQPGWAERPVVWLDPPRWEALSLSYSPQVIYPLPT